MLSFSIYRWKVTAWSVKKFTRLLVCFLITAGRKNQKALFKTAATERDERGRMMAPRREHVCRQSSSALW